MKKNRICIIGLGYVGIVTGICLAELGNDIVFVFIDEKRNPIIIFIWLDTISKKNGSIDVGVNCEVLLHGIKSI